MERTSCRLHQVVHFQNCVYVCIVAIECASQLFGVGIRILYSVHIVDVKNGPAKTDVQKRT
jgi:hypothetical protein